MDLWYQIIYLATLCFGSVGINNFFHQLFASVLLHQIRISSTSSRIPAKWIVPEDLSRCLLPLQCPCSSQYLDKAALGSRLRLKPYPARRWPSKCPLLSVRTMLDRLFSPKLLSTTLLFILTTLLPSSTSVELTFELPDSAKECFYEVIEKGTQATVEFQVSTAAVPSSLPLFRHLFIFSNFDLFISSVLPLEPKYSQVSAGNICSWLIHVISSKIIPLVVFFLCLKQVF